MCKTELLLLAHLSDECGHAHCISSDVSNYRTYAIGDVGHVLCQVMLSHVCVVDATPLVVRLMRDTHALVLAEHLWC